MAHGNGAILCKSANILVPQLPLLKSEDKNLCLTELVTINCNVFNCLAHHLGEGTQLELQFYQFKL